MQTCQFNIYGLVQGVGFRYFSWQQARKIGLLGYVKNCQDGSVLIIAQGDSTQLAQFEQWLQQGPKTAKVKQVLVQPLLEVKIFEDFSIQR